MPRLRVLAGPNANELTPISHLVNTYKTHRISSDRFEGEVSVHVKGFVGEDGQLRDSAYFHGTNNERKGVTWSIQVKGRFLKEIPSDDVLFGNTFDRPLKLPWGSGAALKFMNFVDPTLEHALDSDRPWALSPLITTMPYIAISRGASTPSIEKSEASSLSDYGNGKHASLKDDVSQLEGVPRFSGPAARRSYFASESKRKRVTYSPQDTISTDFCYGFLSFPEIRLNLPGGISFDLMRYWDGQPVRFVCCERASAPGKKLKGPGDPFWVVVFEAVLDDFEEDADIGASHGGSGSEGNGSSASASDLEGDERASIASSTNKVSKEEQIHLSEEVD